MRNYSMLDFLGMEAQGDVLVMICRFASLDPVVRARDFALRTHERDARAYIKKMERI